MFDEAHSQCLAHRELFIHLWVAVRFVDRFGDAAKGQCRDVEPTKQLTGAKSVSAPHRDRMSSQ